MKNFLKPTRVTWIIFIPITLFIMFLVYVVVFIVYFGGPLETIFEFVQAFSPHLGILIIGYLFASAVSWLWYKLKPKKNSSNLQPTT